MKSKGQQTVLTLAATVLISSSALFSTVSHAEQATDKVVAAETANTSGVAEANAKLAFANYSATVKGVEALQTAVDALVKEPNEANLKAAKAAWLAARESYGQSEVFRFRGGPIDDDLSTVEADDGPEGQINAWPLAEGLIDYVANEVDGAAVPENAASTKGVAKNIIADSKFAISKEKLAASNELGGDEANVTTGYHAIEFLLWGQDLNKDGSGKGKRDASAGQRPYTDYVQGEACTHGHCDRRAKYLQTVTALLKDDLAAVAAQWNPEGGAHYKTFTALSDSDAALKIMEGMGRLSYGELAGERMNIALMTDSQEDEHSCFSDNTHRDIVLNAQGIQNAYLATYDGKSHGKSVYDWLIENKHTALADDLKTKLNSTMKAVGKIDKAATSGLPFDQQIQGTDAQKQVVTDGIIALREQTKVLEKIMTAVKHKADLRQDTEEDIESK